MAARSARQTLAWPRSVGNGICYRQQMFVTGHAHRQSNVFTDEARVFAGISCVAFKLRARR